MEILAAVIVLAIVAVVGFHMLTANAGARNSARSELLATLRERLDTLGANDALMFGSFYGADGLAYSEQRNLFWYAYRDPQRQIQIEELSPEHIVSSELIVDDVTVSSQSMGAIGGRALAGGAIIGQAGAVIGGLTSDRTSQRSVRRIALRLVVDDVATPRRELIFYESNQDRPLWDAAIMAEVLTGGNPEDWAHRISIARQRHARKLPNGV